MSNEETAVIDWEATNASSVLDLHRDWVKARMAEKNSFHLILGNTLVRSWPTPMTWLVDCGVLTSKKQEMKDEVHFSCFA